MSRGRVIAAHAPLLVELQAALAAGASPGAALAAAATTGPLAPVARAVRLGTPLTDAVALAPDDSALGLLVRALAVAERAGAGGLAAVAQAQQAVRDEAAVARLLRSRTVQARGTAVVLMVIPVVGWVLLVALHPGALAFYATPLGLGTLVLAAGLVLAAWLWTRRIVAAAARAGAAADPLHPPRVPVDLRLVLALAVPTAVVTVAVTGLMAGLLTAALAGAIGLRIGPERRRSRSQLDAVGAGGGACETVDLVAVALAAGLPTPAALATVAPLAPPAAADVLAAAARRMQAGESPPVALAGTGLACIGDVLGACARWGAPAGPALQLLAAELRADRTAAVEAASERTQLVLVFPTTLLTLPAFVLGVVPPLLWTAFFWPGG